MPVIVVYVFAKNDKRPAIVVCSCLVVAGSERFNSNRRQLRRRKHYRRLQRLRNSN